MLPAAANYYVDGQAYLVERQHLCICHRWTDQETGTEGINFKGIERNLFCDPERMGTFLPGIASKELEISRWSEPEALRTNDAKMEQPEAPEESEDLEL